MRKHKKTVERVLFAIFPKRCAACGVVISPVIDFCKECAREVYSVLPPICLKCGRGKDECLCKNYRFYYSAIAAPFYYEGSVGKCIRNFKFNGRIQNAGILAEEMARTARKEFAGKSFDCITCVPLTKKSYQKRGFNQSFLLAEKIGCSMGIETNHNLLVKIYDTPAQHKMSSSMRRGNLAGVFDVPCPTVVMGKTILLCDDVATTGSTINECAKMLLLYGAKEVCCLTAAVTRKQKDDRLRG
jgi:competence protein ComFC